MALEIFFDGLGGPAVGAFLPVRNRWTRTARAFRATNSSDAVRTRMFDASTYDLDRIRTGASRDIRRALRLLSLSTSLTSIAVVTCQHLGHRDIGTNMEKRCGPSGCGDRWEPGRPGGPMMSPDQSLVLRLARNKDQGHGDRGHPHSAPSRGER